jgi:predicted metalloprotease with PDZ domain
MPVWTPGSYLIREFARNVQDLYAETGEGRPLPCRKVSKHSWRIAEVTGGLAVIRYRVYANELTVRTSHLDASHGSINGASVFLFVRGMENDPVRVKVCAPVEWRVATTLSQTPEGEFLAANYDELVDSPIEVGTHRVIQWMQEGKPHRFIIYGAGELDEQRLEADSRKIINVCSEMFGGLPYNQYLFILHLVPEGRGGLEHRSSTLLQFPRSGVTGDYESLISLIAHEFFHVWLARRIRPERFIPYDFTAENYTRLLWVIEGFTTYYTDRILLRAGLITPARYLELTADMITRLQGTPGRLHQTLEDSSFDTWIRFYRPDAHTPNSQISYYQKGALVAMALDLEIRRASQGERSLDDVMRTLWERYGMQEVGIPEDGPGGIRELLVEVVEGDPENGWARRVDQLLAAYVGGLEEINFDEHLAAAGLGVLWNPAIAGKGGGAAENGNAESRTAEGGKAVPASPEVWPGVRLREDGSGVRITHVLEGSPAAESGVNSGDEIVAIHGMRVPRGVAGGFAGVRAGEDLTLTLLRRDELLTIDIPWSDEVMSRGRRAVIIRMDGVDAGAEGIRANWISSVA